MIVDNLSVVQFDKVSAFLNERKIPYTSNNRSLEIVDEVFKNLGFHRTSQLAKLGFIPDENESLPKYYKESDRGFNNFRKVATVISKVIGVIFGLSLIYGQLFKN
jgi:hypothetical protein